MALFKTTRRNLLSFLAPVSFLLLASCSSYQYTGNEDGIYGETNRTNERGYDRQQNATQDNNGSSYYKNLFAEEAALYGDVLADDMIFTDVDSYTSQDQGQYEAGAQDQGYRANAPWGEDPDSYAINIYNTGFYGGMGFWDPYWGGGLYAFDPFWGPGFWGPGHWGPWGPRWGGMYGSRWGFGMGRGFWGHGWGMGFGMYGYGGHPFFHGGGWYNPYNYYGNRYNSFRQNVAYNTGRRDAASYYQNRNRNSSSIRNSAAIDSRGRSTSYSRSIRNLRGSNDNYGLTRRAVSREYTRSNTNYNTSNRSRVFDARSNRSNNTYSRPAQTRSSTTVRSAPSTTRSSGSVRSSGGRSSSGGTSSRGRGN